MRRRQLTNGYVLLVCREFRSRPAAIKIKNNLGRVFTSARARLQLETPISDDADLLKLQEQAAEYVYEAKRRHPSGPNELVSTVVDAIARYYFGHVIRKQKRRAGEYQGSHLTTGKP